MSPGSATARWSLRASWVMTRQGPATPKGKADPAPLLRAHPPRFRLVHLKDMARDGSFTEIGNGTLDFRDIIDAALQSGVEHFFVEQDVAPDPLHSIETSMAYLRRLG